MYTDVVNQWDAGSNYAAAGGAYPGMGDTLGWMGTHPGYGDTDAFTTGGEVGSGGSGADGYAGYGGGSGTQGDFGGGGGGYYDGSPGGYGGGGHSSGGGSFRDSKGMAPSGALSGGNILVGFGVTALAFVGGAWALHHFGGSEENTIRHLSPSFVNAMSVGAMGVLTIPLWRSLFAQLAHWDVPFMGDVSAYVNGA